MKRRARWTAWLETTPASGRVTFTLEEAARQASAEHRTVSQALRRAAKDGWVTLIHRGLYAWVAPEYRRDKVPPFYWVIQAWMDFMKTPYYVGLLSAASLLGSAQQAPMEYQVLTKHQVRNTGYGRTRVRFVVRKNWPQSALLEKKQGYQDSFWVSGPELTLVDLIKHPAYSGGWDNIATIAKDLGNSLREKKLEQALEGEATPVLQRLGWLLGHLGFPKRCDQVAAILAGRGIDKKVKLDSRDKAGGPLDERFQLWVNYVPEVEG
jgi:predicted transcriptional regulator of viral defense system